MAMVSLLSDMILDVFFMLSAIASGCIADGCAVTGVLLPNLWRRLHAYLLECEKFVVCIFHGLLPLLGA